MRIAAFFEDLRSDIRAILIGGRHRAAFKRDRKSG